MIHLLIDTNVWLDLAENQRSTPLLEVLQLLLEERQVSLLVPEIVLNEFNANRDRVAARSIKSLSSHFNLVKEAIRHAPEDDQQAKVLAYLSDLSHRKPIVGAATNAILDQIAAILQCGTPLKTSNAAKVKAAERALHRKAPFHHEGKNSMADALIIETYFETVRSSKAREKFMFITHNKSDFSLPAGDQKQPHLDLADGFSNTKSLYFISLADCLGKIDPDSIQADVLRLLGYVEEPRPLSEILSAMDELTEQVWYNRHKNREWEVKRGKIKIVSHEDWVNAGSNNGTYVVDSVWEGALMAADNTLSRLGKAKCGPHTDFEWGMINGKLSALRWMLGDDWDMLDT